MEKLCVCNMNDDQNNLRWFWCCYELGQESRPMSVVVLDPKPKDHISLPDPNGQNDLCPKCPPRHS
jgi:hypothetical protein